MFLWGHVCWSGHKQPRVRLRLAEPVWCAAKLTSPCHELLIRFGRAPTKTTAWRFASADCVHLQMASVGVLGADRVFARVVPDLSARGNARLAQRPQRCTEKSELAVEKQFSNRRAKRG